MQKLILWDIDGTLLYSGGVAAEAMRAAMTRVYGQSVEQDRRSYAGKTDQQIILETFADRAHHDLLGMLELFTMTYMEELEQRRDDMLARARVLDGVVPVLQRLTAEHVVQSLLTGNLAPIARSKLDIVNLSQYFDFECGAYGSDHHLRANLVPVAVARAQRRYCQLFAGHDVVVIGDTPNDIDCGRAAGARTIGVATGPFGVDDLSSHGADVVLPDLRDTEQVMRAILGEQQPL